ncbi:MAG: threonylcarbamoyl-AMP synthase [Chloroflexi bacterium]|nr:threonylcarbamoyl-AMP synthase [Chloroflexota bacterium]
MAAIDPGLVQRAVDILRGGGLVAYPTDTVYGLAALPGNEQAVARLFEAKRRDPDQPTPLLIASEEMVAAIAASVSNEAEALMAAFWPGALTIILAKAQTFRSRAVEETVGLRVPDHPLPRELSRLLGSPITGTSANIAGSPEPLTADDVRAQLGDTVDLVIDGGRCPGGRPSTVVDCTESPPRIVRQGAISEAELLRVLDERS